jgi:hypothetical protein
VQGADGLWHLFVAEIAHHCGLKEWQHLSTIIDAVGPGPAGPFTRRALVSGTETHNPYYAFDPSTKTHLIFHVGVGNNPSGSVINCTNGSTPLQRVAGLNHRLRPRQTGPTLSTEDQEVLPYLAIHSSNGSVDGPWERHWIKWKEPTFNTSWFGSNNPSPYVFENGTVLMLVAAWNCTDPIAGCHNGTIYVTRAPSWQGPYEVVSSIPYASFGHSQEDPCIWRDSRGNFHSLFHIDHNHAWSRDGWNWEASGDSAFSASMSNANGSVTDVGDAERPRVWLDTKGEPRFLFTAVGFSKWLPGHDQTFTLVQPILHNNTNTIPIGAP